MKFPVSPAKELALLKQMKAFGVYERDLHEQFTLAGKPGGQNVNKVSTGGLYISMKLIVYAVDSGSIPALGVRGLTSSGTIRIASSAFSITSSRRRTIRTVLRTLRPQGRKKPA